MNNQFNFVDSKLPKLLSSEETSLLLYKLNHYYDLEARSALIEGNLRLVLHLAENFANTGYSIEDLFSIGTIGLIKAIDTFDIDKGVKLSTYISRCVNNEICMYIRANKKRLQDISLYIPTFIDDTGKELLFEDIIPANNLDSKFVETYENKDFISQTFTYALNNLSNSELIVFFYSLAGKTQREIALSLSLSQSYISRIYKKIRKKITQFFIKERKNINTDFTISLLNDNYFLLKLSKNLSEIFKSFLETVKNPPIYNIQYSDDCILLTLPIDDSFLFLAEMFSFLQ